MSAVEKFANVPRCNALDRAAIIIPVYNGEPYWGSLSAALMRQGIDKDQILVVDSSSTDNSRALAQRSGFQVKTIPFETFRHGATRQMAAESLPWAEFLVYLTQDAVPLGDRSIATLLTAFTDPEVGAAYGRQVARQDAGPIERHARLFNYPSTTVVRSLESRKQLGLKAAFFSNSFAAYRRVALEHVGGFPKDTIVSEDVTVAALMLIAGWKTTYQANAIVTHSHRLSMRAEFSRYFDIGVHHGREKWLVEEFGSAGGEGLAFVLSEFQFLLKTKRHLIPFATVRNLNKWISYHIGLHENHLHPRIKRLLSGQWAFWLDERTEGHVERRPHREIHGNNWLHSGGNSKSSEGVNPHI